MKPGDIADRLVELRRELVLTAVNVEGAGPSSVVNNLDHTQRKIVSLVMRQEDVIVSALRTLQGSEDRADHLR